MIYDTVENLSKYVALLPKFRAVVDFLGKHNLADLPDGRTDISGDDVFLKIDSYETRAIDMRAFESHRKYADIQMIIGGEGELCGFALPACEFTPVVPYDEVRDFASWAPPVCDWVALLPGYFAIFMPDDAHLPSCQYGAKAKVRKCVFKVRI